MANNTKPQKTSPSNQSQNQTTHHTTLEQRRAAYAWECVQNCTPEYTNLAKAAPALIMSNGLMQTLAYYQDKGKGDRKPHHFLMKHIAGWLVKRFGSDKNFTTNADYESVMPALYNAEPALYRQATEEAFAILRWIRQFAAAHTKEYNE